MAPVQLSTMLTNEAMRAAKDFTELISVVADAAMESCQTRSGRMEVNFGGDVLMVWCFTIEMPGLRLIRWSESPATPYTF
jgi:hypothetical protein